MARSVLLAGGIAWLVAGLSILGAAAFAADRLLQLLPPLTIDADALRGAATAMAIGVLLVGLAHVSVLLAMRAGRRGADSAGVLLAACLTALLVAISAAAATSAVATPERAVAFIIGALAAGIGAVAYGFAAALLIGELRSGSAT